MDAGQPPAVPRGDRSSECQARGCPARDYDGHGTHTASTAAGNSGVAASIFGIDRGTVSGIAPRARVIAYSACGDLGCVTSDLVNAVEQAVVDGVDVINFSIGGSASLTDPTDIAFLFAADANVWVAASNGNSGPGPETGGSPAAVRGPDRRTS